MRRSKYQGNPHVFFGIPLNGEHAPDLVSQGHDASPHLAHRIPLDCGDITKVLA